MTINIENGVLKTDLFKKTTDTHQYFEYSSRHPYHCKKSIPYNQALRLSSICSENFSFDKRCNDLETWLIERGYSEKIIRKKVLRAKVLSKRRAVTKGS